MQNVFQGYTWWTQVSSAANFIKGIADEAPMHDILLLLPEPMPWEQEFFSLLDEQINILDTYHIRKDMVLPEGDIAEAFLEGALTAEQRASYRPAIPLVDFLSEAMPSEARFWVMDIPPQRMPEWIDFITSYEKACKRNNREKAQFVLCSSESAQVSARKAKDIRIFRYRSKISTFDVYTLCALQAGSIDCSDAMRHYLLELTSILCDTDIPLCGRCIERWEEFIRDPEKVLHEERAGECVPGKDDGAEAERIRSGIWETQLRTLLPVIEMFRKGFIAKHRDEILPHLPFKNKAYAEPVTEPEGLEIGEVFHFIDNGMVTCPKKAQETVKVMKDARNALSHLGTVAYEDVREILSTKDSAP